ncbi:MAG: GNAT family N-acetyltransferase [Terracidiphilus sp.]|jgi:ribosomal protein S18 acetylase RimI-like enzyme
MITIEPIGPGNAETYKAVRLRALLDTPSAFGSTYARESQFTDAEWMKRVNNANGEKGIGYLAMEGDVACGIAGGLLDKEDATRASLVSMWTAPSHRQRGVGRLLVDEVIGWAQSREVRRMLLMVVSTNQPAILFYKRLGFTFTGRTEPYPNDRTLIEFEMSREIL